MSPEKDHTPHVSAVCRAILAANRSNDRMLIAFEVIAMALLIAGDSDEMKTAVSWFLRRCAARLDGDVIDATLH